MCGLLVSLHRHGRPDPAPLRRGLEKLRPRGPDDLQVHADGRLWMGHTRLTMVGGADGRQPIVLDDGALCIVVNGELYGVREVEESLRLAGHRVPPGSDARVVGPLYRAYGLDFVHHLRGEWAVVIWDRAQQRLVAARDPFGVRPLFMAHHDGSLRLASSAEALLATGVPARWSRAAVAQIFQHQYLLPGHTVFDGVRSLRPGGLLVVDDGHVQERRWWALPLPTEDLGAGSVADALETAVQRRLCADARLGVQLSGGIDSAAVTAIAAAARPGITAWTVAFVDDPRWDEAHYAATMARACGADHRVVPMSQSDLLDAVKPSVVAGGAPVINLHGAARYRLARAARSAGVHGLLTGEGADELLYGYAHLRHDHARAGGGVLDRTRDEPVAAAVHLPWGAGLDVSPLRSTLGVVPTFLRAKAALASRARHLLAAPECWPTDMGVLQNSLSRGSLDVRNAPGFSDSTSPVQVAAWLWTHLCLSGSILAVLCDPQELAHGVEGRLPFLDLDVVTAAMALPDHVKLAGGLEKAVLRAAMVGRVPDDVRLRPKQPFMAPPLTASPMLRQLFERLELPPFLSRDRVMAVLADAHGAQGVARTAWDPVLCLALSMSILHTHHTMAAP